jgi:hypothetical protein
VSYYTIISARYSNEHHSAAIVTTAEAGDVAVSQRDRPDLWEQMLGQTVSAFAPEEAAAAIARLNGRIDADAEVVRLKFISPGAGMAMTYQEKHAQAQAVFTLGEVVANALTEAERIAQFPTLSASVGVEAQTLFACAELVISRYEAWASLSYGIERKRLAAKKAIGLAETAAEATAAYEAVTWPA